MRNKRMPLVGIATLWGLALGAMAIAQDAKPDANDARFAKFSQTLSGAKLVGQFTVSGEAQAGKLAAEEYHIHEVTKLDEGDYWMFKARVKYGEHDVTVPMPLEVKWAGDTPVITLDNVDIPLLGKFSARVVIDGDKYAGTWSHGDVGGHLFGKIVPSQADPAKRPADKQK